MLAVYELGLPLWSYGTSVAVVPKSRTKNCFDAPSRWNCLPEDLRAAQTSNWLLIGMCYDNSLFHLILFHSTVLKCCIPSSLLFYIYYVVCSLKLVVLYVFVLSYYQLDQSSVMCIEWQV